MNDALLRLARSHCVLAGQHAAVQQDVVMDTGCVLEAQQVAVHVETATVTDVIG